MIFSRMHFLESAAGHKKWFWDRYFAHVIAQYFNIFDWLGRKGVAQPNYNSSFPNLKNLSGLKN